MRRHKTTVCLAVAMIFIAAAALAADISARINIVLEDGTIMIYAGSKKGVSPGDEFEVQRGGNRAGLLKVVSVKELFSYCELLEGDAQEMDLVVRVKQAPIVKEQTITLKKQDKKEESESEDEKDEDSVRSKSRRRDEAKQKADEEPESETGEKTTAKKKEPAESDNQVKKEDKKTEKKEPAPEPSGTVSKKIGTLASIGPRNFSSFGLSGLLFMPSGNTLANGRGAAHLYYADSSDSGYSFKDTGIGVSYGFGGHMEMAYMYVSNDMSQPVLQAYNINVDGNTNIFSFKYQFPYTTTPSFAVKYFPELRYAAGLQYFDQEITVSTGTYAAEASGGAARLFAVATGDYRGIISHFGVYHQSGDAADGYYDGFGFMGGLEYPLNRDSAVPLEQMSVVLEYDHKAFYLGTMKTISLGLRYMFKETGQVSLNIADLSSANVLVFKGAYNF